MKKLLLISAILSVLMGCNSSEKTDIELVRGNAIVEGKVSNFENSSKVLRFFGSSVVVDIEQTAIIDSLGNFRTEIELFTPQDVNLKYEIGFADLYLKPNDSLFLEIDANLFKQDRYPYYEVSGSNPSITENMRDFLQFHDPNSYEPKYGDSVSVEEYLSDLEQQMIVEDSVLNEFSKQYNPTEEFMNWAKKNTTYGFANYLILYFWYFDINHKQYKTEILNTDLFPVDDDSAIVSSLYKLHLNFYLGTNYFKGDSVVTKLFEEKDAVGAYTKMFDRLIKIERQGLSKDIMLYMMFNFVYRSSAEDFLLLFSSYGTHIENQELVNILQEKKSGINTQANEEETILDLKLTTKSETIEKFWETVFSKHKDKIIYIDIWATWCGPCRSEIPYAIDLHNYFEGKPIAFVNLCFASKKDDWEKFIAKNNIKGDNYFFNEEEKVLLKNELNFTGYPTYMIIDKKGNLINKNAPRPSSGDEIINILNKLIEE